MKPDARFHLAIISDIHYACDAEKARGATFLSLVENPLRRWLVRMYRHHIWLRDPFSHNHLLERFVERVAEADFVVAAGDYCCDTAYVGVMDEPAFQSCHECLTKLRARFSGRFQSILGDHELGKKMLAADVGGLRLASYHRAVEQLPVEPFWQQRFGRYVFIGVTSTILALPVYEAEALPEELDEWRALRQAQMHQLGQAFERLAEEDRVVLFCHDPTALPFMAQHPAVRARCWQIERTIIGHLHSPIYLRLSHLLAGMPAISFVGHTMRRMSLALRAARAWKPFRVLLCPSPPGVQMLKDGGYYLAKLDLRAQAPAEFVLHRLPW